MKRLFLTLILALLAIFIYSFLSGTLLFKDQQEYLQTASNLMNNNLLYSKNTTDFIDYRSFAKRPLAILLYVLFNHQNIYLIRVSQATVILLIFFIGLLFLRVFTSTKRSFLLFGVLFSLNFTFCNFLIFFNCRTIKNLVA